MAPKVFDRMIKLLLNIGAGITVALFMWFLDLRQMRASEIKDQVNSKVGIEEFREFKEENKQEHLKLESDRKEDLKQVTDHFDTRFDDFKDFIIEMKQ